MTPERFQQIDQLYQAALDQEVADRSKFIASVCAGDEELRREVESLLAAHEQAGSFIAEPALRSAARLLASDQAKSLIGTTLAHYRIESILGTGGMGEVYLALDAKLNRKVALKLLPTSFNNYGDQLGRFEQEARAASALNHSNIITIHEIGEVDARHFIVTEFVDGETLREYMTNTRMTVGEVLDVAAQIASALQAAHEAGIVHRDIKPENIMVRRDGVVKVLDFGLAKLTPPRLGTVAAQRLDQSKVQTSPGMVMGTVGYMSPEQARGQELDARTDIWSLGVVLYEMVAGRAPFKGDTPSHVIVSILESQPPSLSGDSGVPAELERIISTSLRKDTVERYQAASDMALDLKNLKEDLTIEARLIHLRTNSQGSHVSLQNSGSRPTDSPRSYRSTDPRAQQKTDPLATNSSTKWTGAVVLGLVLLVALGTVVFLNRRGKLSPAKASQNARQLTNRDGFISASRFTPDGKGIIYSAGFEGKPVELFFTDAEGSESRPAGIQSAALKSVSRSGKIAVLLNFELSWSDGYNGTLAVLNGEGGKPEVVMEGVDDAAFAPDDTLAIVRSVMGEQQLEYPAEHILHKSTGWMSYPRFSPKGDKIAFFEHPLGDFSGSLVVFDLAAQKKTNISTGWKSLKGLAWNPKNNEIWFGGSRVGKKLSINAVSLSGQERTKVYDVPVIGARIDDISDDGKMLINQGSNHSTMMVLEGKSVTEVDSQFAWTTSADLSADGKTLLYYEWGWESTDASEGNSVYLRKFDSSERIQLGPGKALALSPDGNWALALQTAPQLQLVLLSTSRAEPKVLPNRGMKEYHYASFFPDGRQILFTGVDAREDAAIRSYVQDISTGEVHPVTEDLFVALRVSPDGKKVITLQPDKTYYIQPLDGGEAKPIPGLESGDEPIQWSDDGRSVYVKGPGEFTTMIYRVDLANGNRREWKDIDPPNKVGHVGLELNPGGILITPDGKVCVYTYWILLQHLLTKSID